MRNGETEDMHKGALMQWQLKAYFPPQFINYQIFCCQNKREQLQFRAWWSTFALFFSVSEATNTWTSRHVWTSVCGSLSSACFPGLKTNTEASWGNTDAQLLDTVIGLNVAIRVWILLLDLNDYRRGIYVISNGNFSWVFFSREQLQFFRWRGEKDVNVRMTDWKQKICHTSFVYFTAHLKSS